MSTTPQALHEMSATDLVASYRAGTLSPVEVTEAVIAQVEHCEPHIHAFYRFDPEGAREAARASEARWRAGSPLERDGISIDGVPATLKENIATRGTPSPIGTAATDPVPAAADAPPAARMREAGAVILGKTTMPEFGAMSSGLSSLHDLTRNPWNLAMNPGGSSAGAGAGGAAGYGPLHLGTDIGGSVRFPAAWCGLMGLKPSLGRVNIDPPYMGRCAGPMTRTVEDAALMMAVLSRPDPEGRDYRNLPPAAIDWMDLDMDLTGVRIGLQLQPGCGMAVDPQVIPPVEAAAKLFEAAGAIVEPLDPWMTQDLLAGLDTFWLARAAKDVAALSEAQRAKVLPLFLEYAAPGASLTGAQVFDAYSATVEIRRRTIAATKPFDFVLAPLSPHISFPAEWGYPTNDPARGMEHISYSVPFNMSEQPVSSLPCGYDTNGVPLGLQIAAQRFDDMGALRMARAYEGMRGAMRPFPTSFGG
ncbi:amidase [Mangrovicoccus algicola]|uniref:Amidase n=1 Tax=Mangrovicoccus algicola TaxID=2771008 RepID=A0A8J7CZI9_9RHOB|nr:amidase [Mangrovicoccus algicola]MBE3637948.1 amidase [Mangrovicoccus algicola]